MTHYITKEDIHQCLPVPPFRYKYNIIRQSPQVWRIELMHPNQYTYTNKHVSTIWGFIKQGLVYPPLNSTKPQKQAVCDLFNIPDRMCYTTIIPTKTVLSDD